jgi:hypothetical protein
MADEQKPKEPKERKERKKVTAPGTEDSVLTATAKAIGKAAGKVASLAGVEPAPAPAPPHTISMKPPKLQKKNKHRLPRWEKKAKQKAAAAQVVV